MCGGTAHNACMALCSIGLSPRVRGNRVDVSLDEGAGGVYPRVCGGTNDLVDAIQAKLGLSPRVRGNRLLPGEPSDVVKNDDAVYPRVCGGTRTLAR